MPGNGGTPLWEPGGNNTTQNTFIQGTWQNSGVAAASSANNFTIRVPANNGDSITANVYNVGKEVASQTFTASGLTTTYSISGTISGSVQSGVTVNLTGTSSASTTTASDGTYSFPGLSAGSYRVTPGKTGYTFSPAYSTFTVSANISGMNFTDLAIPIAPAGFIGTWAGEFQ